MRSSRKILLFLVLFFLGFFLTFRRNMPVPETPEQAAPVPQSVAQSVKEPELPVLRQVWHFDCGVRTESAPVIADGLVLLGTESGHLLALALADGSLVWRYEYDGVFLAQPAVAGGRVFIGAQDGSMHAVALADGSGLWISKAAAGEIYGAAVVLAGAVLYGAYDNYLYCLDAGTGGKRWRAASDAQVHAAPCVFNDQVAIAGCDGFLRVFDAAAGSPRLTKDMHTGFSAAPVWDGKRLYLAGMDGSMFAVDPAGVEPLVWEQKLAAESAGFMLAPVVAGTRAVFVSRGRLAVCVDTETGVVLWEFSGRTPLDARPRIIGETVVFGSVSGKVTALALAEGTVRWEFNAGSSVRAAVAESAGKIIVLAGDGGVYCLEKP